MFLVSCGPPAPESATTPAASPPAPPEIVLTRVGRYVSGAPLNTSGAEIAAYDASSRRLFVVNVFARQIDIVDLTSPASPARVGTIDLRRLGHHANSVAVHDGLVAVAIEAAPKTTPGTVAFFHTNGALLSYVRVGAQPDMITFTPDGRRVLVANEGEASDDYRVDPEGSVSVIDLRNGAAGLGQADVQTAGFGAFARNAIDASIRIYGPRATVAQDLEPEFIAVSEDSRTAWVTLQENNAIAELDVEQGRVTRLMGLGLKDHSVAGSGIDASDRDGMIRIAPWPVRGFYMPDGIASYEVDGRTFLVTANEGDVRASPAYTEARRVGELKLDPAAFPGAAELQQDANLGRLRVTTVGADEDADGRVERLLSLGTRSFSIWTREGAQVFDSGDAFERITAKAYPAFFNADGLSNRSFDVQSPDKGPGPETVRLAALFGRVYAFIALERIGGVVVYDVSDPRAPHFVQYANSRDFAGDPRAGTAGDIAPEGLTVIPGADSPTGVPLLVVCNELSGTVAIYEISVTNFK